MTKFFLTVLLFSFSFLISFGQNKFPTNDSVHIFWQPGTTLNFSDYKGDTSGGKYKDSYKKLNLQIMAYTGLYAILDVPKKKKDRGKKLEKVYIAPAFDKTKSYTLTNDTLQLSIQQAYFDIAEVWARWARQEFKKCQDTMKGYGTLYIMYSTVISDAKRIKKKMEEDYTRAIIVDKKPGALESWKKLISGKLRETDSLATSPEDCYRFILNKPIEPDYEQSPTVLGVLPDKKR